MRTDTPPTNASTPNRRAFLKGLGGLGAVSLASAPVAMAGGPPWGPAKYAQRFQLFAEGDFSDFSLVWPTPQFPPLPDGTIIRVGVEFPIKGHDVLEWRTTVYLPMPDVPPQVVTLFHLRVDKILLSAQPSPNFGLAGQVIDNEVVSPFGDLKGHAAMIYAGFDAAGDYTTFTLLGGACAGSHASAVRTATGSLHIRGPWQSF